VYFWLVVIVSVSILYVYIILLGQLANFAFMLGYLLLVVLVRSWFVIEPAQGIIFFPACNNRISNGVFATRSGSGGTTIENLFNNLPLKLFGECSSRAHKSRPPGVVLSVTITYFVSSREGAVHF
jgi:hypothetical protein